MSNAEAIYDVFPSDGYDSTAGEELGVFNTEPSPSFEYERSTGGDETIANDNLISFASAAPVTDNATDYAAFRIYADLVMWNGSDAVESVMFDSRVEGATETITANFDDLFNSGGISAWGSPSSEGLNEGGFSGASAGDTLMSNSFDSSAGFADYPQASV